MGHMQSDVSLVLEWLHEKCQRESHVVAKALHGLREIRKEVASGPRQQALELRRTIRRINKTSRPPRPLPLWNKLRDIYSLHPQNEFFKEAFKALLSIWVPQDIFLLSECAEGKILFLHVTCAQRIDLAQNSARSFGCVPENEAHLLCIGRGSVDKDMPPFYFTDNTMHLNVEDSYEKLHIKTFMAYAILEIVAPPESIFKCDDDIIMTSRKRLEAVKASLRSRNVQYAGLPRSLGAHNQFYHGWHIEKCADAKARRRGLQFPLPRKYADGGHVYMIRKEALGEVAYSYFAQRWFTEGLIMGIEDAVLGLIMQAAEIELTPMDLTGYNAHRSKNQCLAVLADAHNGITLYHSRWSAATGRTRGQEWILFENRLARLRRRGGLREL